MAYKYDVFLSYNCKLPHGVWVTDAFLPLFKSYLEEALNVREVTIFKDNQEIYAGQDWDRKIKNALLHSRIMVSIFAPAYFNSEWCKKEFLIMDYRQRKCGYMSNQNPNGIIVPIKISDGDSFPEYAHSFQMSNFNLFSRVGLQAIKTQRFIDFQDSLLDWVESVAHAHRNAPAWDDNWKHPDWINDALLAGHKLESSPNTKTAPSYE